MCMLTSASLVQPKIENMPWSSPIRPRSDTFMAAWTASGELRTSSNGLPDFVMSSSSDGTDARAGDCGSSSAACAVGTLSANVVADVVAVLAPSAAAAAGTSVCNAAAVVGVLGLAVAAVSGTVLGSTAASVGVALQGVQDRLRDDIMRTDGDARDKCSIRVRFPNATCES